MSRADAAARVVGEQVLHDVSYKEGSERGVPIALRGSRPHAGASYSVRVHVDVDGDGQVSRGDYVSTESHSVPTFAYPSRVAVQVRKVGARQ